MLPSGKSRSTAPRSYCGSASRGTLPLTTTESRASIVAAMRSWAGNTEARKQTKRAARTPWRNTMTPFYPSLGCGVHYLKVDRRMYPVVVQEGVRTYPFTGLSDAFHFFSSQYNTLPSRYDCTARLIT